jgi:hypothetical protein
MMTSSSANEIDGSAWWLASTQGDTCLCGRASEPIGADGPLATIGFVDIRLAYYDRPQDRERPAAVFEVRALEISREALQRLTATLRDWLALPLDQLAHRPLALTAGLAAHDWDAFTLSFGPSADLILTAGSVGCEVEIATGGVLRLKHRFVADPTVLLTFVEGVDRSLLA